MRTRFAPSPTGYLHVGGLRTCLYNYLIAKKNKGTFILRIEDTDQTRYVEGAVESLLNTLNWMGLDNDEGPFLEKSADSTADQKSAPAISQKGNFGPYIQSQRTELYRKHAQELLEKDAAYFCFCTTERLEQMREQQARNKQAPMYDRTCLKLKPEEVEAKKNAGTPYVIRQKIPRDQKITIKDLIRGRVEFDGKTIDDQVLIKSDNFPTYHLANVVDDHYMEITHVIRGEEWLPSTPKHIFLYKAFGWQEPEFAHIPLLLNKDKTKLSKRQGDVSVEDYIKKGYCKEAIINFIALLGWHPGKGEEQEMFSLDELVEKFSFEQIHKAGAIFDIEKLNWFNFKWNKKKYQEKLEKIAKEIDPNATITQTEKGESIYAFSKPESEKAFTKKRGEILYNMAENHLPEDWKKEVATTDKNTVPKLYRCLITIEEKILRTPLETKDHLNFYFGQKTLDNEALFALMLNPKMKVDQETAKKAINTALTKLTELDNDSFNNQEKIKATLLQIVIDLNLKNGQVLWPLRVSLTHEQFSPGVFEVIWALGKEETIQRLKKDLERF